MHRKVNDPSQASKEWQLFGFGCGAAAVSEAASASLWLAPHFGGPHQQVPWNPLALGAEMWVDHHIVWSSGATTAAIGLALCSAAALRVAAQIHRQAHGTGFAIGRGRIRHEVDKRAQWMGRGKELASLQQPALQAAAQRMNVQFPNSAAQERLGIPPIHGVTIGIPVGGSGMLRASYEDLHVDIWGPRQGKSTSRVIPAILEAPGCVITTSNKRDVVDATRAIRAETGTTYVFDPQHVAGEQEPWSWDPLSYIIPPEQRHPLPGINRRLRSVGPDGIIPDQPVNNRAADVPMVRGAASRALELAGHFADSDDGRDVKTDAFFDPAGEDLLSSLLLAAALADKPITQVWTWVTDEKDQRPAEILKVAGYMHQARGLFAHYNAADKQRSGVFGTAQKMCRILKSPELQPWVEHAPGRRRFDPRSFVADDSATLYLLSMEGAASAGAILNALTAAVLMAAIERATAHGNRLPTPLLAVLDEAANVVRWRELPKQYSHFGSRGIVVMTVLQSWAQGKRCWGEDGMDALWGTATVRVIGSGLDDVKFLEERSKAIGDHWELTGSVTRSSSGRSVSQSRTRERTLEVSDLVRLPRGRMVVFGAGFPAVLCETTPWWRRPYADLVKAATEAAEAQAAIAAVERLALVPVLDDDLGREVATA